MSEVNLDSRISPWRVIQTTVNTCLSSDPSIVLIVIMGPPELSLTFIPTLKLDIEPPCSPEPDCSGLRWLLADYSTPKTPVPPASRKRLNYLAWSFGQQSLLVTQSEATAPGFHAEVFAVEDRPTGTKDLSVACLYPMFRVVQATRRLFLCRRRGRHGPGGSASAD